MNTRAGQILEFKKARGIRGPEAIWARVRKLLDQSFRKFAPSDGPKKLEDAIEFLQTFGVSPIRADTHRPRCG